MSFSKSYLEKYGWKEGNGLGKHQMGISKPIKASLKFNKEGFGYIPSVEYTNTWWVKQYNEALQNSSSKRKKDADFNLHDPDTTKPKSSVMLNKEGFEYSTDAEYTHSLKLKQYDESFQTSSLLEEEKDQSQAEHEENDDQHNVKHKRKRKSKDLETENLFEACEGRTAHKGARHGMKLSGKLQRLQEQEQLLLQKLHHNNNTAPSTVLQPADSSNCSESPIKKSKHKRQQSKL